VGEIIVFNDGQSASRQSHRQPRGRDFEDEDGYTGLTDPDHFLYHVLSYLECPPHLRMKLFPLHPNLRSAGSCPSLDMPHHLRQDEWCQYREGVTLEPEVTHSPKKQKTGIIRKQDPQQSTLVDVGFKNPSAVSIPVPISSNTRVTLKFASATPPQDFHHWKQGGEEIELAAEPVDPAEPREEGGYYWGYNVRQAASLSAIFTESPFEEGYDVSIGTSERGVALSQTIPVAKAPQNGTSDSNSVSKVLPSKFQHALVVFGGVAGLEAAAAADRDLVEKGIGKANVGELFDFWVNACPGQGSRTIRTEEAVWVALSQLHGWAQSANQ